MPVHVQRPRYHHERSLPLSTWSTWAWAMGGINRRPTSTFEDIAASVPTMALAAAPGLSTLSGFHGLVGIRNYTHVPGFFAQDNLTATGIPAIPPRFGLLDDGEDRWSRFFDHIKGMNARADRFTSYKAFFIARHGEGFHNVAEAKYGTPAWNDVWSKLDGDGVLVWGPDAELTPNGEAQAAVARDAWRREREAGIPLPGRFYVSPLSRALRTLEITMRGLLSEHTVKPIVTENCREVYGVHTCDQRRSRAFIGATYPAFRIERGFAETDQLWTPDVRETDAHVAKRAREVLDSVFWGDEEGEMFISVTGHGGITNGFMAAVGRPSYSLPTGGILPIVVKSVFTPRGSRP